MRPARTIKNIVEYAIWGIMLALTLYASCFFTYMGGEFGYEDLQCRQFPETRKFADEVSSLLLLLDSDATYLGGYSNSLLRRTIELTELHYDRNRGTVYETRGTRMTMQDFIDSLGYRCKMDEYGTVNLASDLKEYNDAWYTVSLDGERVAASGYFYSISHDDYVQILCDNASLNSQNISYYSNALMNSLDANYGYLDEDFSANSYIGFNGDITYVYSPDEDMFYSTLYGWYTVPDTLYFLESDIVGEEPVQLLFHNFASGEEILRQKISSDFQEYIRAYKELEYSGRNIAYYVVSDGKLYTNAGSLDKLMNCNIYFEVQPTGSGEEYTISFHNFENSYLTDEYVTSLINSLDVLKPDTKLYIGVYTTYPYTDRFSSANEIFKKYFPFTIPSLVLAIIFLIVSLLMGIHIFRLCGRESRDNKEIYLNVWDRIPLEIMALVVVLGIFLFFTITYTPSHSVIVLQSVLRRAVVFAVSYTLFMTGLLSLVRRGKAGKFFDKSIIRNLFRLMKKLAAVMEGQKNLQARAVELFVLYWVIMLLGGFLILLEISISMLIGGLLILAVNIGVLVLLLWQARGEQSIRDVTRSLADGNLEYKAPEMRRLGTEQEIINNIDHLSDGLQKAVEKSIYDERMKAELITNVSHDIKTPLTSIINYVDLIKREDIEDEKLLHYIEVLDRKSQRLKQLTEDLVEISKITTGNIELDRVPIDLGELLRQSMGEFEDKFAEQELTMVDNISEQPYMIYADGRRTFRIFENLFQNVYKYAMPGTRVYIDIANRNGWILLSVKNVSKAPLNIAPEELMERFVRGDSSRTTEGSGLGLSIAQNLVQLQDGEFALSIDGDLFKAMITFPEFVSDVTIDAAEEVELLDSAELPVLEKQK